MAIPDNYIDKITKEGDSRMISPAAKMVRVNNENFEGSDLDEVLDEVSAAIDEAGSGGYAPPPGGIPATDLAPAVQQTLDDVANKVDKETGKSLMTAAEHTKLENLPSNPVQSVTINGTTPAVDANGNVNLGNVQGQKGDKGDTGNVEVDGNGNVLIVNNLDDGGTGAALSAEMGKRLALLAGTYAGAWARSKAVIVPFCWLWTETVGGAAICKPIWHIGNSVFIDAAGGVVSVQASAIPAAPTFSETSGSTVGKGTELTITPAVDSALYYKIDNGAWIISDVAVTIEINSTCTITAKCVNNAGSSSEVACSLTVSGPQAPSFAAAQGTTIASGDVVSRGGSIVVSVPQGGELHYSTDGSNYTTASGLSVTIPVPAAGVHIYAYNVQDNDQSAIIDHDYTMAALAAPSMSPASSQLPAGGGTVAITGPAGASIYYTLDGSTPTDQSTLYNGPISVTADKTIKAIAKDGYGYSAVTTEAYTVPVDHKLQYKVLLNGENPVIGAAFESDGSIKYTCTVDWGDGETTDFNNVYAAANKKHTYSGTFDNVEKTITIRGSVVPNINFGSSYIGSYVTAILENSLECDSKVTLAGSKLASISADAYSNNILTTATFKGIGSDLSTPTVIPPGLMSHLSKVPLTSCNAMFRGANVVLSQSVMEELRDVIGSVTNFQSMLYQFKGTCPLPDDFFRNVQDGSVTSFRYMTANATGTITGNGNKLYGGDSEASEPYSGMKDKIETGAASTTYAGALAAAGISPKDEVPSSWTVF